MPDRSVFAPDATWVSGAAWTALTKKQQHSFAPICPEFVIEIRSKSDLPYDLTKKMNIWLDNGAKLAWLIDPFDKITQVFRPGHELEIIQGFDKKIRGERPVQGVRT